MDNLNVDGMSVDTYVLNYMDKEKYISLYNYAKSVGARYGNSACLAAGYIEYDHKEFNDLAKLQCNGILCNECIFEVDNYCDTFEEAQGEDSKGK